MSLMLSRPEPIILDGATSRLVGPSMAALQEGVTDLGDGQAAVRMATPEGEKVLLLPDAMVHFMAEILARLSEGRPVALIPEEARLSIPEAADLLNVSKPYLAHLLDARAIPSTGAGAFRQVVYRDLAAYKARRDAESAKALDELAELSQEMELG